MLTTGRADADHFHEECGVFGIYGHPDAAALTALGHKVTTRRPSEAAVMISIDAQTGVLRAAGDPRARRHAGAY